MDREPLPDVVAMDVSMPEMDGKQKLINFYITLNNYMATISFTDSKLLNAQGAVSVTLRITIGYMQAGGSYVYLRQPNQSATDILPSPNGDYLLSVTTGTIIVCTTTVQDINLATNKTSVIHDFVPGFPSQFIFDQNVNNHSDKVVYSITYFVS
ncbi:hypothetical protein [uncultured Cyclobacterium sp.]|uniref:hypothetical protein n=1 Tax=uncultured Cyclobacterium sp. TaxID=453820 RepID=UPI0030EF54CA